MTNEELVKRLRVDVFYGEERLHNLARHNPLHMEAADRIEELTAKNEMLGREVNIARYGQPDFAWSIHKAAMADLEDKLAKAVEALRLALKYNTAMHRGASEFNKHILTTLAEIEGEKG